MFVKNNDSLLHTRLKILIDNLHEAILVENEGREIILVNEEFSRLFCSGVACKGLIGLDCSNAANDAKKLFVWQDEFILRINYLLQNKQTVLGDELEMLNGTILERDYIPVWLDKKYRGHLWKYRDITNHKILLQQKERLIKELTEHNVLRGKLLAIVSHDLRSPYASLSNLLDILGHKNLPEDTFQKAIAELKSAVNNTGYLLDNVLAWAKMHVELVAVQPVLFHVNKVVKKEFEIIDDKVKEKGLRLVSAIPDDYEILADKAMVDIIIRNLLMNAVKFTNSGTIKVIAEESATEYVIGVTDTGIGLTQDRIEKLFKTESHYTGEGTKQEKGAGFGLLICKDLVEKHKGRIWVESEVGKGSTFKFSILKPE